MPNIRIPDYWRQQVKYILAENQRISISDILHLLDAKAELFQKSDEATERTLSNNVPSPRTISRVREEWRAMEQSERVQYQQFFWPESMQGGALPWEASSAGLELLLFLDSNGVRERPPIRLVMWYWRVIQASRDMSRAQSFSIAAELTRQEGNGQAPGNPGAEWLMAYHHIGRSEDDDDPLAERQRRYREAKDREDRPIPPLPPYVLSGLSINMSEETDPVFWIELGLVSMGWKRTPPRQREEENNRLIAEYKSQAINLRLSTEEDPESQAAIDAVKEE
mgnify:CR=1 FL=1